MADGYMRVKDLREAITGLPDDLLVVMSKDGEGNGFSPLSDWGQGRYLPETTWSGELHDSDDEDSDGELAVVLWPTN